jgi:hypothetical protein
VIPDVRALEQYVPRAELNVAYVPARTAATGSAGAERILDNYDHARARSLLRHLPGANRDGPYLVSALTRSRAVRASASCSRTCRACPGISARRG